MVKVVGQCLQLNSHLPIGDLRGLVLLSSSVTLEMAAHVAPTLKDSCEGLLLSGSHLLRISIRLPHV